MWDSDDVRERGRAGGRPVTIAALDVGSNSFHLLVVEAQPGGPVRVLERAKEMVRLGESALDDGVISPECFDRAIRRLRSLAVQARAHRPDTLMAVATSAVREASNGRDFVEAAQRECGVALRVIDGVEEARLIYSGARQALGLRRGSTSAADRPRRSSATSTRRCWPARSSWVCCACAITGCAPIRRRPRTSR
jgi:exopolyphosphatase/guanosine-5'-triphosphate,3'-diphosphate pyrophosphatase